MNVLNHQRQKARRPGWRHASRRASLSACPYVPTWYISLPNLPSSVAITHHILDYTTTSYHVLYDNGKAPSFSPMGQYHLLLLLLLISTVAFMSMSQMYALVPPVASAFGCARGRILPAAATPTRTSLLLALRARPRPSSSLPRHPRQFSSPVLVGKGTGQISRSLQSTQLSLSASSSSWQLLGNRPRQRDSAGRLSSSSSSRASAGESDEAAEDAAAAAPSDETFKAGDKIQVEVLSFGPLGASVGIVARSHDPDDVLPESDDFLGRGLILQKEIQYYRQARDGVDVVRGEILPAYAERVRETGNVDVSLRAYGGKAKVRTLPLLSKR
jgi:hypothetical protein